MIEAYVLFFYLGGRSPDGQPRYLTGGEYQTKERCLSAGRAQESHYRRRYPTLTWRCEIGLRGRDEED